MSFGSSPEAADSLFDPKPLLALAGMRRGLLLVGGPEGAARRTTAALLLSYAAVSRSGCVLLAGSQEGLLPETGSGLVLSRSLGRDVPSLSLAVEAAQRFVPDVAYVGLPSGADDIEASICLAEAGCLVIAETPCGTVVETRAWVLQQIPSRRRDEMCERLSQHLAGIYCQVPVPLASSQGWAPVVEALNAGLHPRLRRLFAWERSHTSLYRALWGPESFGFIARNMSLALLVSRSWISKDAALACSYFPSELQEMLDKTRHLPGARGAVPR